MHDKQTHEWYERLNEVLYREWDPIGCGVPPDEYMSFVPALAGMLWERATVPGLDQGKLDEAMIAHLKWAEKENIGLDGPFDQGRAEKVIAALKAVGVPGKS